MNDKPKCTPGPWRVGDAGATIFGPSNGNPSPPMIAQRLKGNDARLIVEAVNHHAELVAAVRELLAAYEKLEHEVGNDYQEVAAATDARVLLVKLSAH